MPAPVITDLDAFARLAREGAPTEELAERFACSPRAVQATRRRLGLPAPARRPQRTPSVEPRITDTAAFVAAVNRGETTEELAKRFECSTDTVRRTRARLGIPSPARRLVGPLREKVDAAIADGWSFGEVARTYGVTHETLRRHYPGRQWALSQGLDRQRAERHFRENVAGAAYAAPVDWR
jgi:uncharacterized protein (DUF433 family)